MSKAAQVEVELEKLSQAELRLVRDWLDNLVEDDLEFTPECESALQQSERELAANGLRPRTRLLLSRPRAQGSQSTTWTWEQIAQFHLPPGTVS
jgi:hypothetical protein